MIDNKKVKDVIKLCGGIAKTVDFKKHGIKTKDVITLCDKGYLTRIRHGYYELTDNKDCFISDAQYLKKLIPEAIVCGNSALFYYGYSEFVPREWTIAVPRTISRTKLKIDFPPIEVSYVQDNYFDIGKTTGDFDGVKLSIYDRERSICDCFRFRATMDCEAFNKAVNAYVRDEKMNLRKLSKYAELFKIDKKVAEIIGILLNA